MQPVLDPVPTAQRYRRFAEVEAAGTSPQYQRLARAVAADPAVLALLDGLGPARRQPNLLFGALRYHGVDTADPDLALAWVRDHPDDVVTVLTSRRTQTNEAARCALLLPFLARAAAGRPIALIELGASAGLCLRYDRYSYAYSTVRGVVRVGSGEPELACEVRGVDLPTEVPRIAWRAGADLNPLDPADPDDRRWLQALVWPEHVERAVRLDAALRAAAADRPRVVRADFVSGLRQLLAEAPEAAAVVVTHSAALVYAETGVREEVRTVCAEADAVRMGVEGPTVLPWVRGRPERVDGAAFVVSVGDDAVALADGHGRWLHAL